LQIAGKLFFIILLQSSGIGINYSLLFYSNLCKLEEIIFSIILFQSSRIAGKLLSLSFIPIFANWRKIPPNYCQIIAILFIYIVFLPLFGYFWGKITPTLMNKIFNY
jgi:hypothetical protein